MRFDKLYESILEDFNIYPNYQNANQSGPDAGTTTGQPQSTFPSRVETVNINLPSKKDLKINRRRSPKEKQAKSRSDIQKNKNQE
jgi:hypothetical protein